ncbi:AMP-binding protein [Brevibacillus laterosporus]|uniref:AMP-binding protein n=1 Tax=Brevibacillus laterosporus TaxID=1465 RepID=UPI000CE2C5A2|nr:AMP-binding protein [Brevibacillus laterosporus]MED1662982.1 AMP-binding protein [Brevibacillus laterosporus]MED1668960.1 AMP-binding protein [Brevibacillus laterosporus]MED1716541.1 AMP-binding protein [Brevibacillus laterosporus]PPA86380.1 acyl-CoA synthetase [Brevibacillus laterosporus]
MLIINENEIGSNQFDSRLLSYLGMPHFQQPEGKRYALCLSNALDIISLVLYLRDHGASVLLIHGETPEETAYQMAVDGQCYGLIYHVPENFVLVPQEGATEQEPSVCQYSSGTTGQPKLVRRSWKEINVEMSAYNQVFRAYEDLVPIVMAPVTHSYGLICGVLATLERGSKPLVVTHKNPKFAWEVIKKTPQHIVYGVPLLFHVLSSFTSEVVRFHRIMTSGAPMPEQLFTRLQGMTDTMMQQYGCSETGCISISEQMTSHVDLGKPLSHVTLTAGVETDSPAEITATINNKTIYTRDLGYWQADHIQFVARMDDVINVSGLKVFPMEVEEMILKMDGMKEVVVYRGQHPVMGEVVKAMVVADENITPSSIRDWCLPRLPAYKVPFEITCVQRIPKTPNGKVSRRLLEMEEVVHEA